MYKIVIIEDEYNLREALSIMLETETSERTQIVGYAEGLIDAVTIIDRLKPNLVFMDIILKNTTGFEVLSKIHHKDFHLIFTTAHEEYAVRAFKFNAIDYLLKPIDPDELKNAIERIDECKQRYTEESQWLQLSSDLKKSPDRIVLPTQEAMHVVKISNIIRCETSGSYTTFFLSNEKKIIVSKSLRYYEDILVPPNFFRVHQSHLINVNYIISYSKEGLIMMEDKSTIPISRSNRENFFKLMKNGN